MTELFEMISNHGIGVVCVGYLIYFQSTTMKAISDNLSALANSISIMNERLSQIEGKITEYHEAN